ncbi:hypothetical protein PCANC_00858 [Puccinia coronata f. sp. avenae]|uniref:Uncharacterized protein n=1 Tax=Puccinia coronata f. sp. avenae TaxID=200324 RepID=A0A2N5W7P4_9BASI|nr:hypothetical protein PCANC_00858 [Puccinia coronata f. sp. avenae]
MEAEKANKLEENGAYRQCVRIRLSPDESCVAEMQAASEIAVFLTRRSGFVHSIESYTVLMGESATKLDIFQWPSRSMNSTSSMAESAIHLTLASLWVVLCEAEPMIRVDGLIAKPAKLYIRTFRSMDMTPLIIDGTRFTAVVWCFDVLPAAGDVSQRSPSHTAR